MSFWCAQPLPQVQNMKISGSDTASSTDVQQPVGVKISCKNLTATEEFKCSVSELYRALTDREVSQNELGIKYTMIFPFQAF